ncbi:MAG: helix-turn-helix domain-containing protein [Propionibacteriales bacterium]|nr:helix-turn-helix domain-containing protein [Propionibacteriales bacterium]
MQTVAAVTTTGIYCRPGCAARPHSRNVLTYPSAAAAESAGFRACLRCRPYRSPVSVPWTGPELVCRAVRLILSGALDDGGEADLAARLGVSARHLRRLFTTHLGVTPDGLARSARVHFARRLLDDTDLTITEVAYAAGFGSLRQFNRVCIDVFRASPRELRRRRRKADRLIADGGLALRLLFRGPMDWDAMFAYFAARAIPGVEHVEDGIYRRTVLIDGDPGVLELGPGGDDHLILRAHLPHWESLTHIADRARRIANLDMDASEPVARLTRDPLIGPLVTAGPGLRPPGTWDPFEVGVRAILDHRAPHTDTNALMRQLVAHLGDPVPGLAQLGLCATFPSAQTLAVADLTNLNISQVRADAVRSFARAVADHAIRLDRSVSLDELLSAITSVGGVEPQVAHYIAFRLGEPDAWPISIDTLDRALEGMARRHTPPYELVDRWRPWRALAVTHLWRAAEPEPEPEQTPVAHAV